MSQKVKKRYLDFYDHITLGLKKTLYNSPYITDFQIEKNLPCQPFEIQCWEKEYNIKLPNDIINFYLSTNGLQILWNFKYSKTDIKPFGNLNIPKLMDIKYLQVENDDIFSLSAQLFLDGLLTTNEKIQNSNKNLPQLKINPNTKIFELLKISDLAKVCLIYENEHSQPKIYLFEMDGLLWNYLAESFTQYLRMAIVHLCLPLWELSFSSYGLPPWVEQICLILAPHLLIVNDKRRKMIILPIREKHCHTLDEKIFKMKYVRKRSYKIKN